MANEGTQQGSTLGTRGDPGVMVRLISVGSTDIPEGPCRAIICSEEGTITFRDHTDTSISSVTVMKGVNPIGMKRITAVSGTMTVWALY